MTPVPHHLAAFWVESTGVHWSPVESIWTLGGTAKYWNKGMSSNPLTCLTEFIHAYAFDKCQCLHADTVLLCLLLMTFFICPLCCPPQSPYGLQWTPVDSTQNAAKWCRTGVHSTPVHSSPLQSTPLHYSDVISCYTIF